MTPVDGWPQMHRPEMQKAEAKVGLVRPPRDSLSGYTIYGMEKRAFVHFLRNVCLQTKPQEPSVNRKAICLEVWPAARASC